MSTFNMTQKHAFIGLVIALLAGDARADLVTAVGGMAFMNSSQQGGQGPEGSTVLSQVDIVNRWSTFGLGFFAQADLQGSNETDIGYGPKIEARFFDNFYIEGGYIMSLNRSFNDRSIAEQTGYGWLGGIGARFALGGGRGGKGGGGGMFLQFSYKYRIHVVKEQDGNTLSQPITQKDGYPLFGIGMSF